jgi:hypothetical protein
MGKSVGERNRQRQEMKEPTGQIGHKSMDTAAGIDVDRSKT